MHTQQVTATHANGKQYVWTNDPESQLTLEDWKAKPFFADYTFSALVDNPEIAIQAARVATLNNVTDAAAKELLAELYGITL